MKIKQRLHPSFRPGIPAAIVAITALACASGMAQTPYYWDADNAAGLQGGSGIWGTPNSAENRRWQSNIVGPQGQRTNWDNDGNWQAIFQVGATSEITVNNPIIANSIIFTVSDYSVIGINTITLSTGNVTTTADGTINAPLAGSAGLTKLGPETLTLGGNNAYTGNTTVSVGTLNYAGGSVFHWNLDATGGDTTPGAENEGAYSRIIVQSGATLSGSTVFEIPDIDFSEPFWLSDKIWTDIIDNSGTAPSAHDFFASFSGTSVDSLGNVGSFGSFSFSGNTLTWTIPEPTTALAGMLLAAGILRRRRK